MPSWVAVLFAGGGIAGFLGALVGLAKLGVDKSKTKAEARLIGVNADDLLTGRALDMYDRVSKQAERAESKANACSAKVDALEVHLDKFEDHVDHLERIMRDNGLNPPPAPPSFVWPPITEVPI